MLGYLSTDIICSEKRTVFRERSPRKTVSYKEQIMSKGKYPSIFSPQMETIVFIILQIFFTTCTVLKIGEYSRIFPSFSWGIFGHMMWLDQSRGSKKIWCIINTNSLSFWPIYHQRLTNIPPTINGQRIGPVSATISTEISADSRLICRPISRLIHRSIRQPTHLGRHIDQYVDVATIAHFLRTFWRIVFVSRATKHVGCLRFFDPPCCCFGRTLDICTWNETVSKDYICTISLVWFPYLLSSL